MLRDVMSASGLSLFAQIGLVIFFLAFVAVVIFLFVRRGSPHWERARHMPLDDDRPQEDRRAPPDEKEDR